MASLKGCKTIYLSVNVPAGKTKVSLDYESYLDDKCIKAIFLPNNSVSRENEPVFTTADNFWLDLYKGRDVYHQLPAKMLDFNDTNILIEIDFESIDWNNSQFILPAPLLTDKVFEIVVFYLDKQMVEINGQKVLINNAV